MSMEATYWAATDPYPREHEKETRIHPFYAALGEGRLTTSRCRDCGDWSWPPRVVCPSCYSEELDWGELPRVGRVTGFTIQEVGLPPGFEGPAVFVLVDVGPVRIFSRLTESDPESVEIGAAVEFVPVEIAAPPGQDVRRLPAFRVVASADAVATGG